MSCLSAAASSFLVVLALWYCMAESPKHLAPLKAKLTEGVYLLSIA